MPSPHTSKLHQVRESAAGLSGVAWGVASKLKPRGDDVGRMVPSGNLWHSYWKWPFIVDFPIKNCDFQ